MKKTIGYGILTSLTLLTGCNHGSNSEIVKETYIHKYGVTVAKNDWESRGGDGEVVSTLRNGVQIRKNYQSNMLHGITSHTFPHSQTIEKTETYENGFLVKMITNYQSGLPKDELVYLPGGGTKKTSWYEAGTPRSVEELIDNSLQYGEYFTLANQSESKVQEGKGSRSVRNSYGQLISTDTIEGGEMVSQITYNSNGTPKMITPFHNGEIEGRVKHFHPGGEPEKTETWLSGLQHGLTTVYQNGEKFSEVMYIHGKKQGVEKRFRNGEMVEEEITWSDDKRHGPSYAYLGDSVETVWFYNGERVTKSAYEKMNRGIVR